MSEISGSENLFEVSIYLSKHIARWIPGKVTIYLPTLARHARHSREEEDWEVGDEGAIEIGLIIYQLLELICMTRSKEAPMTLRHCKQEPLCPTHHLAYVMLRHIL